MKTFLVNRGCSGYYTSQLQKTIDECNEGILVVAKDETSAVNIVQNVIEHYSERYTGTIFAKEVTI